MLDPKTLAALEALALYPRADQLDAMVRSDSWRSTNPLTKEARADLAPIMVEKLRHLYAEVLEVEDLDLPVANGQLFPIDDSVPPAAVEWQSETMEAHAAAQWIGDDGRLTPTGHMVFGLQRGRLKEMGDRWDMNTFDLERAAMAKLPVETVRARASRRAIDAKCQWTWLFGDREQGLYGVFSHPNIPRILAPAGASTSRLWSNKTNDEIMADIALLVDSIRTQTVRRERAAIVYMPDNLIKLCQRRYLGLASGLLTTLWDAITEQYKGDLQGVGKVEFRELAECEAAFRVDPNDPDNPTDTSGISGDFLFVMPAVDKRKDAFMRSRRFTQLPPQQEDFNIKHLVHAKIGGFRTERPLAFGVMVFA